MTGSKTKGLALSLPCRDAKNSSGVIKRNPNPLGKRLYMKAVWFILTLQDQTGALSFQQMSSSCFRSTELTDEGRKIGSAREKGKWGCSCWYRIKPAQHCKAIIFQLKINKFFLKLKKKSCSQKKEKWGTMGNKKHLEKVLIFLCYFQKQYLKGEETQI